MIVECLLSVAALLLTGIEAAYVPTDNGGGDYLVRVEPDLVQGGNPYHFTSDVPADSRDVRRVRIYVADAWPPAVERSVIEAAKRPRRVAPVAVASARSADQPLAAVETAATGPAGAERPWGWRSANARGAIGAYPRPRRDFCRPRAGAPGLTRGEGIGERSRSNWGVSSPATRLLPSPSRCSRVDPRRGDRRLQCGSHHVGFAESRIVCTESPPDGQPHHDHDEDRQADEQAHHPGRTCRVPDVEGPSQCRSLLGHPGSAVPLAEIKPTGPVIRIPPFGLVDLGLDHASTLPQLAIPEPPPVPASARYPSGRYPSEHDRVADAEPR